MTKLQFATWVHYYLLHMTEDGEVMLPNHHHGQSELEQHLEMLHQISHEITTQEVDWENEWESHIPAIHHYWKEGRLVCEHTNLLSG